MSLILLADDSPHALRMGEQILREEGYDVVCAATGTDAARWLAAVDPDIVMADAFLPGCDGLELCRQIRSGSRHARVVLTAGSLEDLDEATAKNVGCDAVLRKPFEASEVLKTVAPLARAAALARQSGLPGASGAGAEEVQAVVARTVQEELPRMVEEITRKVLLALAG